MNRIFDDFLTNLRSGMHLAFFRRCNLEDFRFSLDQLVLLLALDLLLEVVSDFALNQPEPQFSSYALPTYAFSLGCVFLAAYLTGKLAHNDRALLRIGVIVYSFGPLTVLLQLLISYPFQESSVNAEEATRWLSLLFSLYTMLLICKTLYLVTGRLKGITAAAFMLMMVAVSIPQYYFADYDEFWYATDNQNNDDDSAGPQDSYAEYRALDAEQLMYRQPEILNHTLDALTPQRNNVADLFFVGFAGYAFEDVFSKEVAYAKQVFDRRFDTRGHSLNLVNNLRTMDNTPLATATNLALALQRIGQLMNPEEDVLFLYLTSHGSEDQELSVDFWPLPLKAITPETLRAMLDKAGIKWRVVVVSACYSGGYVKALQGPGTLVATAAAADRTSFGCGNEFDFTYFGEAIFKQQLQREHSLLTALQQAKIAISERESREDLEPSRPQLSVGAEIKPKLQRLGEELHRQQCATAKTAENDCRG